MKNFLILSCQAQVDKNAEDQMLKKQLEKEGQTVKIAAWNDPSLNWNEFKGAIIRSTWDYYLNHQEFLSTMQSLASSSCQLFNPWEVIKWNSDKIYLKDLEGKGVPIVPTLWLENFSSFDASETLQKFGQKIIFKPRVSAGAYKTIMWSFKDSKEKDDLASLFGQAPLMVQPFLSSIREEGEYSFIFFHKKFHHCIVKKPAPHDFRVQEEHRGTSTLFRPSAKDLERAEDVISKIPEDLLYARVDMARNEKGELLLMECELIEPQLFFTLHPAGSETLAQEILKLFP